MEKTEVQVRRKIQKSHLPSKIVNKSKKAVASVYKDRNPLGINDKEVEKRLLCDYLNIDENDRTYGDRRKEFWTNFRLVVPVGGVVLNIATRTVETEDGEEIEQPLELNDYITYLWLQDHPLVAKSEQEMKQNPRKEFYIYDPVRETAKDNVKVQSKKQAYIELHNLTQDEEKLDIMVRLMRGIDPEKLSKQQKENFMSQEIENNPAKFVSLVTDEDLEIRAEIEQMVDKGILRKQGNSYLYMDTTIGDSLGEAISYFKNKRNSEVVLDLRSRLKDIS